MCQFPYPLTYFFDGLDGDAPKLALEIKGVAVGDFTKSECGRFEGIDPQDYYGLSAEDIRQFALLKETVMNASQEAISSWSTPCSSIPSCPWTRQRRMRTRCEHNTRGSKKASCPGLSPTSCWPGRCFFLGDGEGDGDGSWRIYPGSVL